MSDSSEDEDLSKFKSVVDNSFLNIFDTNSKLSVLLYRNNICIFFYKICNGLKRVAIHTSK